MKIKILTLLFLCCLLSQNLFSQKFGSMENYQKYFLENINSLDKIEGVWQVNVSQYDTGVFYGSNEFIVCIIKENGAFYQYKLENGYYKPSTLTIKFTFLGGNSYKLNRFNSENQISSTAISNVYANSISYEVDITPEMNFISNTFKGSIKFKYNLKKIFPLESDIAINKDKKSTGTGFAISSDGYIVTNHHVIENATKVMIKGVKGDFSKSYSAKVIQSDKNNDLAILKIVDSSFSSLGSIPFIFKSSSSNVGENIFVLGYPLTASMGEEIKLTNGIISSKSGFQGDITTYQMTAPIQPGNSGAPLFDKDGNLIGIVNAKHIGAENAGYAIKSSYLINLIDAIPLSIPTITINILKNKTLTDQVNIIKKFVFVIEVN